jgi:sugar phosphate isomerase/epimerase
MANDTSRAFAEVGSGRLDFERILDAGRESNVAWFLVEQDECRGNPLEAVKKSYEFLHKRLGAERSCGN